MRDDQPLERRPKQRARVMFTFGMLAMVALGVVAAIACAVTRPRPSLGVIPPGTYRVPERSACERSQQKPAKVADLEALDLREVSGVVASLREPGLLWMHNDSGDSARVFAVSDRGQPLGTLSLPDVDAVDIEDIAAGPCPDLMAPCLYLADTGDNNEERESLVVYAVAEPAVSVSTPLPDGAKADLVWRLPFTIPDGPANIEAFVVLPDASAMVFFEKKSEGARILRYPAPWKIDVVTSVDVVGTFDVPGPSDAPAERRLVTGADLHPSGTRLLVRTYLGVYEARLDLAAGKTVERVTLSDFGELFLGPEAELQGEAVAYDGAGTGIWTVSERPKKTSGQPLHYARCE